MTCKPVICPPTNCAVPKRVLGQCCSMCDSGVPSEECHYRGHRYDDGSVFTSRENECEDCRCEAGEVHCKVRSCPPHSCEHPALNRCCPLCRDCQYRDKLYRHNKKFVNPDDVCQNCQCRVSDNNKQSQFFH